MTDFRNRVVEAMARAAFDMDHRDRPAGRVPVWDEQLSVTKRPYRDRGQAALTALLSELDAAGWQLAPRITTDAMEAAAFDALEVDNCKQYECATDARIAVYTAMLAAAPHPFPEDKS